MREKKMKKIRKIEISTLKIGTVLLVQTKDKEYKFIVDFDDTFTCTYYLEAYIIDEEEYDEPHGEFIVATIAVGQPITGVGVPRITPDVDTIKIDGILQTSPVKSIEIYD